MGEKRCVVVNLRGRKKKTTCECTGNKKRRLTDTTGGGVGKRSLFSVKSSTLNVADMITNLRGLPF